MKPLASKNAAREIKRMTKVIVTQFKPEKIILFGSHAWGEPDKESDIDFLIIKETKNRRKTRMGMDESLYPRDIPLDLLLYTPKQIEKKKYDFFIHHLTTKGRVLYEKK